MVQPYVSAGLGISYYNVNYDTSPTTGETIDNVSFTMMPLVGLKWAATPKLFPYLEVALILVADGPPAGFPESNKMTGYYGISAGLAYRFW